MKRAALIICLFVSGCFCKETRRKDIVFESYVDQDVELALKNKDIDNNKLRIIKIKKNKAVRFNVGEKEEAEIFNIYVDGKKRYLIRVIQSKELTNLMKVDFFEEKE
jgi:hypothetical protein